jgi:hypothetical protein
MTFNDGILDIASDPALLFEELGPFAVSFDDFLLDPSVPPSDDDGQVIDSLPPPHSNMASHLDTDYTVGPTSVVTHDEHDSSAIQPFHRWQFNSNELDNAQFGDKLTSLDLTLPSTSSGIGSPRTLAFLVEVNEILSNSIPPTENPIHAEINTVTALDDTTLDLRPSWQVEPSVSPTGDADTSGSHLQETNEIKDIKELQSVFPINPKSEATSGGSLKPRRYIYIPFKMKMLTGEERDAC